jgi:hypothetical protein
MFKKFFPLAFLLAASSTVFADPVGDDLFDVRIANHLYKSNKSNDLSYIVTLPSNEFYYTINEANGDSTNSDPWRLGEDRIIEGKLKTNEWKTIRVYGSYDPAKNNQPTTGQARVTVIDPKTAHVVWKGEFNYDRASNIITATTEIENKKSYAPRIVISGDKYAADVDIFIEDAYYDNRDNFSK